MSRDEGVKAVLHGQIMQMVQEGQISPEKYISIEALKRKVNASLHMMFTTALLADVARDAGYLIYRLADDPVICLEKSIEQIEWLKTSWAKDPCWDIEETDGFEAYAEELRVWHSDREARIDSSLKEKKEKRAALVREQTGVNDADIVSSLYTWSEIETDVNLAEANAQTHEIYLQAALVRATLLQAAQLKRIADALEKVVDLAEDEDARSSLAEAVRIFGTGE